jgi:hypothetical protein
VSSDSNSVTAVRSTPTPQPPPPPRPTQPVSVSFRSVLMGQGVDGEEAPPLLVTDDQSVALKPQLPLASMWPAMSYGQLTEQKLAAAPAEAAAAPAQVADAMDSMDLEALVRPTIGHDDMLSAIHRQRAIWGGAASTSSACSPELAMAQPSAPLAQAAAPEVVRAQLSLEELLPGLVRRVQWSGDGRKGTMRMELAGAMAGSTLLVSAEAGRVRVQLDVPPGVNASDWQARITQRLADRNIPSDGVEVT